MNASATPLECFVTTAKGHRVRVRLLGRGPALVMCHESPRSGAALLPLAARLSEHFTCVMLDTPGFGLTDPLPMTRPEIPDYAAVVLAVTERLGLDKVAYYGTHTGAAIVIEVARQSPSRVTAVFLDGYALFSETERDELLASYLTPIQPSLDGTDVAWLWSRVRDQFTAFPWHRVGDAGRLRFGPPPIDTLQAVVVDFLLAGDHYRAGYSAAFRYDHLAPVQTARVPVFLAARTDDLLFKHLNNATDLPDNVVVEHLPADRDAWGHRIGELLQAPCADQPQLEAEVLLAKLSGIDSRKHIANTSVGPVVLQFDGKPDADPLVLLHDAPGDSTTLASVTEQLADRHRVIRLDLPGMGDSRLNDGVAPTIDTLTQGVREALVSIKVSAAPVVAFGASLPIALNINNEPPIVVVDPWPQVHDAVAELPDLTPRWDGAHLFAAFYWARDYDLYKPWYHRQNAQGRKLGGERDVNQLHQRYRASIIGGTTGMQVVAALYAANCQERLATVGERVKVLLYSDDPDKDALQRWVKKCGDNTLVYDASRDAGELAQLISGCLGKQLTS